MNIRPSSSKDLGSPGNKSTGSGGGEFSFSRATAGNNSEYNCEENSASFTPPRRRLTNAGSTPGSGQKDDDDGSDACEKSGSFRGILNAKVQASQSQGNSVGGSPSKPTDRKTEKRDSLQDLTIVESGKRASVPDLAIIDLQSSPPGDVVSPGGSGKSSGLIGSIAAHRNSFVASIQNLVGSPGSSKAGSGWHTPNTEAQQPSSSRSRTSTKDWGEAMAPVPRKVSVEVEPVNFASFLYNYLATVLKRSGKNGTSIDLLDGNVKVTTEMIKSFEEVVLEYSGKFQDTVNVIRVLQSFGWKGK